MIVIRKGKDRGQTRTNWLQSLHTFSFADYYDPEFLGFGNLVVINEDTVKPGYGFGAHSHHDMEIISYVVEGAIKHLDSTGNSQILEPGQIQRMTAGTGITHGEVNPSSTTPLHFLQIWILPNKKSLTPSYEQKYIPKIEDQLILIGSLEGNEDAVIIHQNVQLYVAYLNSNSSVKHSFKEKNTGWVQIIKGEIDLNGQHLSAGDGAAISDEEKITIKSSKNADFLLFDFFN